LLVGLNYGGKHIWAEDDFDGDAATMETRHFYPTYICMDVTDPREPPLVVGALLRRSGHEHIVSGGRCRRAHEIRVRRQVYLERRQLDGRLRLRTHRL
jgi:hypothetical protein